MGSFNILWFQAGELSLNFTGKVNFLKKKKQQELNTLNIELFLKWIVHITHITMKDLEKLLERSIQFFFDTR